MYMNDKEYCRREWEGIGLLIAFRYTAHPYASIVHTHNVFRRKGASMRTTSCRRLRAAKICTSCLTDATERRAWLAPWNLKNLWRSRVVDREALLQGDGDKWLFALFVSITTTKMTRMRLATEVKGHARAQTVRTNAVKLFWASQIFNWSCPKNVERPLF